ncbi:hypothetical protein C1Y41_19065 [Pantoea sp. ICBG 1758]|uniref:Thoeris anti-defense Tad2 family protein n=1 Tax=Pantoea sp. ICBG 1758 TaxID=2071682 RepID=UPI000CE4F3D4|nr:DUF2829 domain-containing protein [Pantoea sp. ICBG 1758]PPC61331.1 hypothetical protein C1Y41_19065 [Pantoea sp. ICBG 1758]
MSDIPRAPSPAAHTFASAMLTISQNSDAICRRAKWGDTANHVSILPDADDQIQYVFMNDIGTLNFYCPSPEDMLSADWQVIALSD